jgi:hypothetical protein
VHVYLERKAEMYWGGGGEEGRGVKGGEGGRRNNWNNIHFSNNRQGEEDEVYLLTLSAQNSQEQMFPLQ